MRKDPLLLVNNGGPTFLYLMGWLVLAVSLIGFFLEGFGGLLAKGDFFFQLSHEVMYLAFAVVSMVKEYAYMYIYMKRKKKERERERGLLIVKSFIPHAERE